MQAPDANVMNLPENSLEQLSDRSSSSGGAVPLATTERPRSVAATFTRNAAFSVVRLAVATIVALVLPAYLTHKLPVETYAAWVLVLQLGAYVAYLDFGVQTGVAKFVAEYEARGDFEGASQRASAGLAIMSLMSLAGCALTLVLAWRVPSLFHNMPAFLYREARIGLLFVGLSLSFGLFCSVYAAVFLGLQRFAVPMVVLVINRILFTVIICLAVFFHRGLAMMGALAALVNVFTGVLQIGAWRKLANHVQVSLRRFDYAVFKKMLAYCSVLAIWSAGMLCVSGLDLTIVARYDFGQTGFYSIATQPTNFMAAILVAALGPFLPTASALSVHNTPEKMGQILSRTTRYSTIILLLSGLPLMVAGYPILRLWVGPAYALHTVTYLRILVLANIVRNICMPYATMLVATESQKIAIAGAVAEAIVNVGSSIYLARHIGALGVAYGTLLGSFVSVAAHVGFNLRHTYPKFAISRTRLLVQGVLRPSMTAIPSILLLRLWWSTSTPFVSPLPWIAWAAATILLAWFVGLKGKERVGLAATITRRMKLSPITAR
jgi:O-antigen/teichoic acid export membrane protein